VKHKRDGKYFLKQIKNYAVVGGMGALLLTSFSGCDDKKGDGQNDATFTNASQKQNAFVIIEKKPDGGFTIVDEYPSSKTTIVLRDGQNERILSKAEIDALVAQEAVKIDNGTSNLTNPHQQSMSGGGMGLGEVLLSSIAGAMIGSYIGNKLFNNSNYQSQRRTNYKSPSTFSRSASSFNKAKSNNYKKSTSSSKKSGFFGSSTRKSSSSSRSFFGG
jgi:hypothetical protein